MPLERRFWRTVAAASLAVSSPTTTSVEQKLLEPKMAGRIESCVSKLPNRNTKSNVPEYEVEGVFKQVKHYPERDQFWFISTSSFRAKMKDDQLNQGIWRQFSVSFYLKDFSPKLRRCLKASKHPVKISVPATFDPTVLEQTPPFDRPDATNEERRSKTAVDNGSQILNRRELLVDGAGSVNDKGPVDRYNPDLYLDTDADGYVLFTDSPRIMLPACTTSSTATTLFEKPNSFARQAS